MAKYTSYKAQIGVNRGAGITDAINMKAKETSNWGSIADSFAQLALTELQETGKKAGREKALQTKIIDKEIITTNDTGKKVVTTVPTLPKTPDYLGHSATKAFEETIYSRFESDTKTSVDKIITEEYLDAKTKDASPSVVEAIINEKRQIYIDNLRETAPIFAELIDDYWEKKFQKTGLAYLEHYNEVRKDESRAIEKLNIAKDSAQHIESLISGEDFKHDNFIASIEQQVMSGVLTRKQADIIKEDTINARNFATNFVETYAAFIGLDRDEIDVNNIATNTGKNINRNNLLALLSNKADAPTEIELKTPTSTITLKREDVLKLAQNKPERFEVLKDFLKKTEDVSSELAATKLRQSNFRQQTKKNFMTDQNDMITWDYLELGKFRNDLDKPIHKADMINAYNTFMLKADPNFQPLSTATAYNDNEFLGWLMQTQGTVPESVHRKWEAAIKVYNGDIITDEVFSIINIPKDKGIAFSYDTTLGFDAKATKILEGLASKVNEGAGTKQGLLTQQAQDERQEAQKGIKAEFVAQGDFVNYTPEKFWKEVHEKVNSAMTNYKDRYRSNWIGMDETLESGGGFGAYFHARIFRGILAEMQGGMNPYTSSHDLDDAIKRVIERDGFAYKFGISKVGVGIGAKTEFGKENLMALPPERFMPTLDKDKGYEAFNIMISKKFINNLPSDEHMSNIGGANKRTLKITGGGLAMIPVNLNQVDNPDLRINVINGKVRMDYYLVYYDKAKDRIIFPTNKNGEHYIVTMDDAKEAEKIRQELVDE